MLRAAARTPPEVAAVLELLPWRTAVSKPYENPVSWYREPEWWRIGARLRRNALLHSGARRAQTLLPFYQWPQQMLRDARAVLDESVIGAVAPRKSASLAATLATDWAATCAELDRSGLKATVKAPAAPSAAAITGYQFIYGPPSVSDSHAVQHWLDMVSLVVAKDEADFIDHGRQTLVYSRAAAQGAIIQVRVRFGGPFVLEISNGGSVVFSDTRPHIDAMFMSPHFRDASDCVTISSDGSARLAFTWRLLDLDDVVEQRHGVPFVGPRRPVLIRA